MKIDGVYIIAEIGWNWEGDLETAIDLIHAAKDHGADVAKFQLYDIDLLKSHKDDNYFGMKSCQLEDEELWMLAGVASEVGIDFAASAFDPLRLSWLDDMNIPFHKIAARMTENEEYCKLVISKNLPVIATTKRSNPNLSNHFNVKYLWSESRRDILKKGLVLPAKFGHGRQWDGFSDHTVGLEHAKQAIDHGALIIEKHFTFDRNAIGWDQPSSMTPKELEELVKYAKQ